MKMLFAAVGMAALIPVAAAAAQVGQQRVERVIIAGADGPSVEVPEDGLTREAWGAGRDALFARLDADGDGRITRDETRAMAEGPANWTSDDGRVRVVRREGGSGARLEESTIEVSGDGGERHVIIRRSGSGGETINIEGGEGGGDRQVFVFRTEGEGGLDADRDGRLSFEEMAAPLRRHFAEMDDNGDGFLSDEERESHRFPAPPAPPAPPRPPVG